MFKGSKFQAILNVNTITDAVQGKRIPNGDVQAPSK